MRKWELPAFRPMKAGPVPSSNKHITKVTLPSEWDVTSGKSATLNKKANCKIFERKSLVRLLRRPNEK